MSYNIAGMAIKNEYLALGTIISTIGIAVTQLGGSKDSSAAAAPAPVAEDKTITASSSDEEDFIRQFVAEAEKEGAKH